MRRKILPYNTNLKEHARNLRKNLTVSERVLWSRLRRKQLLDVQFYRQKAIGNYIVDFFAPRLNLVVEVDGSQHKEEDHFRKDTERDAYMNNLGIDVLRFNSREVLKSTDEVMEVIFRAVRESLGRKFP